MGKDHIKIALPLLYCTYFAGLLLFRQSTKSIRKREKFLCLCVYYLDRVTAGNTDQTWASFFLYRISTKLAGVKMTQDPPFQYVLLILTLSRKVIVQALSMMLIKKKSILVTAEAELILVVFFS